MSPLHVTRPTSGLAAYRTDEPNVIHRLTSFAWCDKYARERAGSNEPPAKFRSPDTTQQGQGLFVSIKNQTINDKVATQVEHPMLNMGLTPIPVTVAIAL